MKLHYITALAAGMALFSSCGDKASKVESTSTPTSNKLETRMDSVNYAFGVDIGNSLKTSKIEGVNPDFIKKGIAEVLDTTISETFTGPEARKIVEDFFREVSQKQQAEEMKKYEGNKAAGIAFLEANKEKPGIVALPNGLQYEVLKEGKGKKPAITDKVKVHYHGTLIDGKVFDSSVERGQPFDLSLNQVIPGWTQVLQLMPVGSKWKVYIPSELGYRDRPAGEIPPFSTLIFEIELLDIVSNPAQ